MLLLLGGNRLRAQTAWADAVAAQAGAAPAFAFDFAGNRHLIGGLPTSLSGAVSTVRPSTANYFDAADAFQTAAANVTRLGRVKPGATLGLLSESARTNLMASPAAPATQAVTVTAQAYTLSFYGTGTIAWSGAASGSLTGSGDNTRVQATFTPSAGTLTLTCSGSLTRGQIEAGTTASSWISGARGYDLHSVSAAAFAKFNPAAGTFLVKGTARNVLTSANLLGVGDGGATNNRILINIGSGGGSQVVISSTAGANGGAASGPTLSTTEAPFRCAFAYAANDLAASFNGGTVVTDASVDLPVGVDRIYLGASNSGSSQCQTPLTEVYYWPERLANAKLQAMGA